MNPHFDTLLARTVEFLRGGTRSQLALFLAHNKVGAFKAFDDSTQTGWGVMGRIIGAEKMLNRIVKWQEPVFTGGKRTVPVRLLLEATVRKRGVKQITSFLFGDYGII